MFDYTQAAAKQIAADFQKVLYIISVCSQAVYIGYLLYALFAGAGVLWVNIVLLAISSAYFAFFLITTKCGRHPSGAKAKIIQKTGKRVYKYCKMLLKIYPLALTIYGFYQTTEKVSFFALLLVCFMIIGWILQIVFEVFGAIFSNRFALIMDGVKADVEEIKRPVTAVGNFFKKITGKEVETPKEPTKNQLKLREKVEQFRAERKEKRELQKQELIEKRKQKKIDEKAQKEAQKQEKEDRKAAIAIENKLLKSAEKQEKSAQKQEKRLQKKALPAPPAEDTATSVQPVSPPPADAPAPLPSAPQAEETAAYLALASATRDEQEREKNASEKKSGKFRKKQ